MLRTPIEKNIGGKQLKIFWVDLAQEISYKLGVKIMHECEFVWIYLLIEEWNLAFACIS